MRQVLLAAVLALGGAAPLAAQNDGDPSAPAPGSIVLVSAPDALLASYGDQPLDPDLKLCLADGEEAVLASDRVTFTLAGDGCVTLGYGERKSFEAEEREAATLAVQQAEEAYELAYRMEDIAQAKERLDAAQRRLWIVAPPPPESMAEPDAVGNPSAALPKASPPRARIGAIRPTAARPPAPPPRPIIFRLASASPGVLQRYPKGTLVQRSTALCLSNGEEATIVGSNGQSVSYTGPGCLQRKARPTGDNIGGFTFG